MKDADIVVIPAGIPRGFRPRMTKSNTDAE
jgi:malate/lactate dehydrogenase